MYLSLQDMSFCSRALKSPKSISTRQLPRMQRNRCCGTYLGQTEPRWRGESKRQARTAAYSEAFDHSCAGREAMNVLTSVGVAVGKMDRQRYIEKASARIQTHGRLPVTKVGIACLLYFSRHCHLCPVLSSTLTFDSARQLLSSPDFEIPAGIEHPQQRKRLLSLVSRTRAIKAWAS